MVQGYGEQVPLASPGRLKREPFLTDGRGGPGGRDHGVLPGYRYHLFAHGKKGGKCSLNTIPVPGQLLPGRIGIGQITPGSVRIISGYEGYLAPVPGGGTRHEDEAEDDQDLSWLAEQRTRVRWIAPSLEGSLMS